MAKVKFYTGNLRKYAKDGEDTKFSDPEVHDLGDVTNRRDMHSIRVYESNSFDGDSTLIDTIKIAPGAEEIWAENASDDFIHKWYRLEFVSDPSLPEADITVFGRTEPIVPEQLYSIVDDVREWLGDTDLGSPAWPDKHYIQNIRFAVKQYKGEENLTFLKESDIIPIQLLVREIYALAIAYDHGKYYQLQAPAATLDKSQIMTHYLQIVEALRAQYAAIEKRLNLEGGGVDNDGIINQMPSINCQDASRYSVTAGKTVTNIKPNAYRRRNYFYIN